MSSGFHEVYCPSENLSRSHWKLATPSLFLFLFLPSFPQSLNSCPYSNSPQILEKNGKLGISNHFEQEQSNNDKNFIL